MPNPPRPVPRGFVERGSPAGCGTAPLSGEGCCPPQVGFMLPERGVEMPGVWWCCGCLAPGGRCVPNFCQPLKEWLFPWLGFAAACPGLAAWESTQECALLGLIYFVLIIPNRPVLSTSKCFGSVKLCHPFALGSIVSYLVAAVSCRSQKQPPWLESAFCLFVDTLSDKHQYFKSSCLPFSSSSEQRDCQLWKWWDPLEARGCMPTGNWAEEEQN